MPYRRRRSSVGRRAPRRKVLWATFFGEVQPLGAANIINNDLLGGLASAGVGIVGGTIVRTHLSLQVRSLDTDLRPSLIVGLIVQDPSTSIPNVGTDFYADWMLQHFLTPGTSNAAVVDPSNAPTGTIWGRQYDVRARRRIHEMNDHYWLTIMNRGSASFNWTAWAKVLVALP